MDRRSLKNRMMAAPRMIRVMMRSVLIG
jgi:hypothetical protein